MSESEYFDVIIVGCGAAGIATGIDLHEANISSFVILEARDRIGGRAYTKMLDGIPVDLGANWIHHYSPNNPLYKYTQNGELLADNQWHTDLLYDYDGSSIPLHVTRKAQRIAQTLFNIVDDYRNKVLKEQATDVSIAEVIEHAYEKEVQGLLPQCKRVVDLIMGGVEQYEASNLEKLSATYYEAGNGDFECDKFVQYGYGLLLQKIGHNLPVRLNTIVTHVDTSDRSLIEIRTNHTNYTCKYLLITIPLGCLKKETIMFHPRLPEWKLAAIRQMGFGLMNKIILQFPYNFWNSATYINRTSNLIRGEFRCMYSLHAQYNLSNENCNILVIFTTGNFAYEIETLTDQESIERVMKILRTLFESNEVLIPNPLKFLISRWSHDPFAYGSYSNFAVNATEQIVFDLSQECFLNRVHWAGEHTNEGSTIGCVDSAFESGQREAKKIIEKLNIVKAS
ncbi:unnamed protein product [Didymodactylos carnosus]|uniref:Amine oxidase n=1 Tax=Didymodactylos carnosus TaxID=1234261 RepID=A0A814E5F9_9BILA|nr:unnamed protein product [Didymodactylos carnosus]CAF3739822.1 unnamed protein product [Didymodactylos carnosus]